VLRSSEQAVAEPLLLRPSIRRSPRQEESHLQLEEERAGDAPRSPADLSLFPTTRERKIRKKEKNTFTGDEAGRSACGGGRLADGGRRAGGATAA
jgi:hypothetical protein